MSKVAQNGGSFYQPASLELPFPLLLLFQVSLRLNSPLLASRRDVQESSPSERAGILLAIEKVTKFAPEDRSESPFLPY